MLSQLSAQVRVKLNDFLRRPQPGAIPLSFIRSLVANPGVIVEAGAHIGTDTVPISTMWPMSTVHAFEPIPVLHARLAQATRGLRNVRRHTLALSDHCGTSEMFVSAGDSDGSSSLHRPKEHLTEHPGVCFEQRITVPIISLDAWAGQQGIPGVDMLWLDMQGHELAALQGARRILPSVQVIHTEVNLKELYAGAPLYGELRAWLESQGFVVVREALPWADAGNVLFARQRAD